jgi:hypothetical protein
MLNSSRETYGKWSAITYQPIAYQKQLISNTKAVASSPYAEHFDTDLAVPSSVAKSIQSGPLDLSLALTPSAENLNRMITPGYKTPDNGYAVLGDKMAYAQCRIIMPEVTTEMFKWWFTWHVTEKERYMLWFPHAHIDTSVTDPARSRNTSLSYEQRLYGNPNRIQEWIGPSRLDATIHFSEPSALGFDNDLLKRQGFVASASAVCYATPAPDIPFTLMVHIARDTDAGMELFSRYWIGSHPDMARFANEMSVHDMTEFTHLARVLPGIYRAFA